MLKVALEKDSDIATLKPERPLSKSGFDIATGIIDPCLEEHGELRGLIIDSKSIPG